MGIQHISEKILESNGQYNAVTEINLWSGNLKENLEEAIKNKRLNDYIVSLALIEPSISIEYVNYKKSLSK